MAGTIATLIRGFVDSSVPLLQGGHRVRGGRPAGVTATADRRRRNHRRNGRHLSVVAGASSGRSGCTPVVPVVASSIVVSRSSAGAQAASVLVASLIP
jgi:hypothetical protein